MTSVLRRDFPPVPEAVPAAREAIEVLRDQVAPEVFEDLRLMVSELVTNSLRHADLKPDDRISLTARLDGPVVRVEVEDPGSGFTPPRRTESSPTTSGWGLVIVGQLATDWGVRADGGTRVWFEMDAGRNA
jgi:anti-sigma regulatory factor (Ser/Thr protein kinase)